ncbi:MAG: ATP-dependent Clp protease proteolytic subunit [Planctomycetes bacterium]|nr:ATP-dependent Clp protease proteolytic subunit [Planctomycetota bacterium]
MTTFHPLLTPPLTLAAAQATEPLLPIPGIYEKTAHGERGWNIFDRLLADRIVFVGNTIIGFVANSVIGQLLFLQKENKNQDVNIYINCPGGDINAGLAMYDTMQFVQCPVATYCIGEASSMAALLLAAGTKGKRYALPHARIMIHQPWGNVRGTATDIRIQAEEMLQLKKHIYEILAAHTGKSVKQIEKDADRDYYMSAEEAKEYGIVDEVVGFRKTKT